MQYFIPARSCSFLLPGVVVNMGWRQIAAVPVCAAVDTSTAASLARIPLWIFYGADDPAVNPLHSVNMVAALLKACAHPGISLYPVVGHFSG